MAYLFCSSIGDNRFEVELRSSNKLFSKKPILQVLTNLLVLCSVCLLFTRSSFKFRVKGEGKVKFDETMYKGYFCTIN